MKRTSRIFVVLVVLAFAFAPLGQAAGKKPVVAKKAASPKSVIVFIADGCGAEHYTLARWFKGAPLAQDAIMVGGVKTYISDSVIADSAPAATAFATGVRASDKQIGIGPRPDTITTVPKPSEDLQYRPLATVLEGARLLGKSTGLVSTSRVTHATPAAYVAHVPARSMEEDIMEQCVYQGVDVVLGGGMGMLLPKTDGGKRADGENLANVLTASGYSIVKTRQELAGASGGKVFGMFAKSHMEPEIDRPMTAPDQPTLAEMTRKAIEILSKNPNGFFLMVEGSQVDWADHSNDPAQLMSDMLAYDEAVKVGLEFAKKNGATLLLALSDHNTGGFSIGNYASSESYSQMSLESVIEPLKKMKASTAYLWAKVGDDKTPAKVKAVVAEYWGIEITDDEAARILAIAGMYKDDPYYGFGEVICPEYTELGWSTHGHTGGDVPLFAYGPNRPVGLFDGPEIAMITAKALGIDLARANQRLFVEAADAFDSESVSLDASDEKNPVVVITYMDKAFRFPVNKSVMESDGKTLTLEGVAVYAPNTGKAYIPAQAVKMIKKTQTPLPSVAAR